MDFTITDLFNKVKSILPFTGNNKLGTKTLDMVDIVEEEINNVYQPTIELLNDNKQLFKGIEATANFKMVKDHLKVRNVQDLINDLESYGSDVTKNLDALRKAVKAGLHDVINEKTMSLKQYSLFRLVEDTLGNIRFALRISYFILIDPKNSVLSRKFSTDILKNLPKFRDVVLNGDSIKKQLEEIAKMPIDAIYDRYESDAPSSVSMSDMNKFGKLGFLGNPIYTFRKWLVDREMQKREDLLTNKNMIELRLLELRNIEAGNPNNETIQKQIEYYEDFLESLDQRIAKIERVED